MRKLGRMRHVLSAWLVVLVAATTVMAQEASDAERKAAESAAAKARALDEQFQRELNEKTPLQVQVVISRYQGEKRISSMPYVLAVNGVSRLRTLQQAESSMLRMGARVPVTSMPGAVGPVTYEDIGTNIDCRARAVGDGTFELRISLVDRSLYPTDEGAVSSATESIRFSSPVFRTFQTENTLTLRDGQARQFTAATDRVSGEVTRVEVTLTVVK